MSSRLPSLGPRGEGWAVLQIVILWFVIATGMLGPAWTGLGRVVTTVAGAALVAAGGVLVARAVGGLRGALTPFPRPRADAVLIETGAFRLVRHPIYGGLVLASFGWGLVAASPAALGMAAVLLGFFDLKSRREEAWLLERYPGYAAYRAGTRRMLPFIY